jgi:histidine triad (HIT) family protein
VGKALVVEGKAGAEKALARGCKFCAIIAETEKSFTVYRDDMCIAFLDYRPLMLGHVLLVPLAHYETLADVPDAVMAALGPRIKRLSGAVMQALDAEGSFVALNNSVSQSVPHAHFHIVPRRKGDGLLPPA